MFQECEIVCFDCKQTISYRIGTYLCPSCSRAIVDPEIESLVVTLNIAGVQTERSCQGHNCNDVFYPFPWVVIAPCENMLSSAEILIFRYNCTVGERDRWETQYLYREDRHWIVPIHRDLRLGNLQASAKLLAEFIEGTILSARDT